KGAGSSEPAAVRSTGLPASLLAVWLPPGGTLSQRLRLSLWGFGTELIKAFHYVAWLPALLGMWWFRDRARIVPGAAALLVLCLLQFLILLRLAVVVGYVSDRHVLLFVLCGTFPAVLAVRELPRRVAKWTGRLVQTPGRPRFVGAAIISTLMLL